MKHLFLAILICGLSYGSFAAATTEREKDDQASRDQIQVLESLNRRQIKERVAGRAADFFAATDQGVFQPALPSELAFYPSAYGFDRMNGHATIEWGVFHVQGFALFTVKMTPVQPNGKLVIFAHGYLDHVGRSTNFFDELVRGGYTVITYDMPGHGLSSGPSASITDFKIYASILADYVNRFQTQFNETILAGFSTGGSAILEARMYGMIPPSMRVVLVAPLVRIKYWWIAEPAFKTAFYLRYANNWSVLDLLIAPATAVTDVTKDRLFLQSHRLDPLRPDNIPSLWTYSYVVYADILKNWSERLTPQEKAAFGPTLMIEGRDDSVVDGPVGMEFINATFPQAQRIWIPQGGHHLLNEGIAHFRKPRQTVDLLPLVYEPILQFIGRKE